MSGLNPVGRAGRSLGAGAGLACGWVLLLIGPTAGLGQGVRPDRGGSPLPLEQALRVALERNPSIRRADASLSSAKASRWADWGAFLPTISLSGSASRTSFTNSSFLSPEGSSLPLDPPLKDITKSNNGSLSLRIPLLSPDRVSDLKAGSARASAAGLRLSAAEALVVRDVKRAYFEALKQQRLLAVAERQRQAREQDLDVTRKRYEIAAASRSDLLGAEIDLADAELRHLDAGDALASALRELEVQLATDLAGVESGETQLVDVEVIPDASGLDASELAAGAIRANPTLLALEQEERAASSSLWSARAQWLPTFDASLSLGRSRRLGANDNLFDFSAANTSTTVTISGTWTLFNNFSRKRATAQADMSLRQARADITRERLDLERDIRDLVADLTRRHRRLAVLETNQGLADERLELAREQYRLGSISYFNLQQAIDRLNSAEQSLFQERYDYLKAWADLEERLGRSSR